MQKDNITSSYLDDGGVDPIPTLNSKTKETSVDNRDIEFYKTTSSDNQLNIKLDKIQPRMKINKNSYQGGIRGKHSKVKLIKYKTRQEIDNYNSHLLYNPRGKYSCGNLRLAEKQELVEKIEEIKETQAKDENDNDRENEYTQDEHIQELMVVINKKKAMNNYFKFAEKQQRVKSGIKKTK